MSVTPNVALASLFLSEARARLEILNLVDVRHPEDPEDHIDYATHRGLLLDDIAELLAKAHKCLDPKASMAPVYHGAVE